MDDAQALGDRLITTTSQPRPLLEDSSWPCPMPNSAKSWNCCASRPLPQTHDRRFAPRWEICRHHRRIRTQHRCRHPCPVGAGSGRLGDPDSLNLLNEVASPGHVPVSRPCARSAAGHRHSQRPGGGAVSGPPAVGQTRGDPGSSGDPRPASGPGGSGGPGPDRTGPRWRRCRRRWTSPPDSPVACWEITSLTQKLRDVSATVTQIVEGDTK